MLTHDDENTNFVITRADGTNISQGTKSLTDFQWLVTKRLFTDNGTQGIAHQWLKHLFIAKEDQLELGLPITARIMLIEKSRKVTPAEHLINRRYNEDARIGNLIYVFNRFDCSEYDQALVWWNSYRTKLVRAAAFAGTLFDLMHTEEAFNEKKMCFTLNIETLKLYAKVIGDKDIILNGNAKNNNNAFYLNPKTQQEQILMPTIKSYQEFYTTIITHKHPLTLLEVLAMQEKA